MGRVGVSSVVPPPMVLRAAPCLRRIGDFDAHLRYVDYLGSMPAIAGAGGMMAEQRELFLFALGESF